MTTTRAVHLAALIVLAVACGGDSTDRAEAPTGPPPLMEKRLVVEATISRDAYENEVRRLFDAKDYAELDRLAADARDSRAEYEGGRWQLTHFYRILTEIYDARSTDRREAFLERIANWTQEFPESITPQTVLLARHRDNAWRERGVGMAQDVKSSAWDGFREHLTRARRVAKSGDRLDVPDPEYYRLRISLARDLGRRDALWEIFQRGAAIYPRYTPLYETMVLACLPRWGGSPAEIHRLAEESVRLSSKQWGEAAYFYVAAEVSYFESDAFHSLYGFDWKRIKDGYADIVREGLRTDAAANWAARMACEYEDREEAQRLFGLLTGPPELRAWTRTQYDMWRAWAFENSPRPRTHPIHVAAAKGDRSAVEAELAKGVAADILDDQGYTAFAHATAEEHWDVVRVLLAAKADPNQHKVGFWPALANAVYDGQAWLVEMLLEAGADVRWHTNEGWTALHLAAEKGHRSIVAALLADPRIEVNALTTHGEANAEYEQDDLGGQTPLLRATDMARWDAALLLLAHGADPTLARNDGGVPLENASRAGPLELLEALLAAGAEIMHADHDGWTALHAAATEGRSDVLALFIAQPGVNVDVQTNTQETAAHRAARAGHLDAVTLLLEHGADFSLRDMRGNTPLMRAEKAEKEAVVAYLRAQGIQE